MINWEDEVKDDTFIKEFVKKLLCVSLSKNNPIQEVCIKPIQNPFITFAYYHKDFPENILYSQLNYFVSYFVNNDAVISPFDYSFCQPKKLIEKIVCSIFCIDLMDNQFKIVEIPFPLFAKISKKVYKCDIKMGKNQGPNLKLSKRNNTIDFEFSDIISFTETQKEELKKIYASGNPQNYYYKFSGDIKDICKKLNIDEKELLIQSEPIKV